MKKLLIIALVFSTTISFSQDRERNQEMRQNSKQERQDISVEQRAEITVKRLTEQLDLNETQQKKVLELQLVMAKKRADGSITKDNRSEMEEIQKAYRDNMKSILTKKQYDAWNENQKKSRDN
jgi:protein CpxP